MDVIEYSSLRPKARPPSHRLRNLGTVAAATILTVAILLAEARRVPDFRGPLLLIEGVIFSGATCCIASMAGLAARGSARSLRLCLAALCLLPAATMPSVVRRQMEREYSASRLHFLSDLLECPVPANRSECDLVPQEMTHDLVYHFRMAKSDLDQVLNRNRYKPAARASSLPANDLMYAPGVLSLGPNDEIYVLSERGDDVRTLRLNAGHTEGYLRLQHFMQTSSGLTDVNRR